MWAQEALLAVSGAKSLLGFLDQRKQAIQDKKWQKYNNTMVAIQNAGNQNNITINENLARAKAAQQAAAVRKSAYQTKASAEVAAAAAGTTGRSVDIAIYDIERNEAMALEAVQRDLQVQYLQFDDQRRGSELSAKMAKDFRGFPMPSPATAMLGFAVDAFSIMNE